jgi:aldose 1-epimerase
VLARTAPWGRAPDGAPIERFELSGARDLRVVLASWGATLVRVLAPDRHGTVGDVVLGFDALAGYTGANPYLGGTIGRHANRIAGARFSLHGRVVELGANEPPHHLHGGFRGFDRRPWRARAFAGPAAAGVVFQRSSPAGEEGYPGRLEVEARYTLTHAGELHVEFEARTDAPTVVSMTQHAYWNLRDGGAGDMLDHELEIAADFYTPVDREGIPTGGRAPVAGTALDFRTPRRLRDALHERPAGLDHNLALRGGGGALAFAARLRDPASGRALELATTAPGLQLYAGGGLDGRCVGRGGVAYRRHAGLCLEPQRFPDAPNQPAFASSSLEPGERYLERCVYRFLTDPEPTPSTAPKK